MKEQLVRIYEVLNELYKEGYVPAGEFQLVKPSVEGKVDIEVELNPGVIGIIKITTKPKVKPLAELEPVIDVRRMGYSGNTCVKCSSHRMVRRGTCELCEDCGETSGCS